MTLIEVLITLLVLAIGLLGLAALQGVSLRSGQDSYHRTQATTIAYELTDFARSNRGLIGQAVFEQRLNALGDQLQQGLPGGDVDIDFQADTAILTIDISWAERERVLDRDGGSADVGVEGSGSLPTVRTRI